MRSRDSSTFLLFFFFVSDGESEENTNWPVCMRKHIFSISDVDSTRGSAALRGPNVYGR